MGEYPVESGRERAGSRSRRVSRELLIAVVVAALVYELVARPLLCSVRPAAVFPSIFEADVARAILSFLAEIGF